jgi:hypothetical protein
LNLISKNETAVQKFVEFFTLQTREHFGGRVLFDDIVLADYDEPFSEEKMINSNTNIITRALVLKPAYMPKIDIKAAVEPMKTHIDNVKKMNNYG